MASDTFGQQQEDRFRTIERKLGELVAMSPGLNEKVDFSVSGASIQEFLRGLAEANNLNISVDPQLNFKIYNNFKSEKVSNILIFLAREYDLDIRFVGSIMSVYKYTPPVQEKAALPVKEVDVRFIGSNNILSLDLKNDTLSKVVKKITQVTKKNVILSSGLSEKLVSVYIEDAPFDNAMEKMAFANQLKVTKTEDNFYILSQADAGDDLVIAGAGKGAKGKDMAKQMKTSGKQNEVAFYIELNEKDGKKFITCEAANTPIADVIKGVAEEMGINYFMFSELKGNTTTHVKALGFSEFLSYLLQGTEYTYKEDKGLYLIGERKLEGLRANKVIQLQYRSLDAIQEIIPAEIRKGVEIKEFRELNSILLTGALPQILEIEAFVKELDRVVPMVMIEVIMLDIRKGRTLKTGIKAGLSDTIPAGGSVFPGIDFTLSARSINDILSRLGLNNTLNLGRVTPNFYVNLQAIEENDNIEVRSMPKLSTLNGHDANLSIGTTRYYSISTQNVMGSLNPQTVVTQQFNAVHADLAINIKPIVAGDDQVTLTIDVSISDFIGTPPDNAPPPSSKSQFKSIIRVRNEEMIVMGGLERTEKSEQGTGTPILSRIPVIKWLFSSRTRTRSKVVSVVFIKPTIIY